MKQIMQDLASGATTLVDVPAPMVPEGAVLINVSASVISAGTERMLREFGKANLLQKARQQPDKVRQVLDKMRTDGVAPTLRAVRSKLDRPITLGYSCVGRVVAVGTGVTGFSIGDRVASNGNHAEVVCVPENLCARVPDGVPDEKAAFTVIAAIALQGIRLVNPTLGERVAVIGLGLIGLITVQLLKANGCRVLGIDPDPSRRELASRFGAEVCDASSNEQVLEMARQFSSGRGVDGVIITASTRSNEPIVQAAQMSRKRGRVVLVGVVGLELSRADFFEKELTFQVSCSYGPGRYDPTYELKGLDYPFGLVRWTEQRNFEAVLDQMRSGELNVDPLITHRFALGEAEHAYEVLEREASLGILLTYPDVADGGDGGPRIIGLSATKMGGGIDKLGLGMIGAGNYGAQVLMPALKATGARLVTLGSFSGASGVYAGKKFGFEKTTTDPSLIFADEAISAVVVATRHDSHAHYVVEGIRARKHVFVEKPLAIARSQLREIEETLHESIEAEGGQIIMVGFNRRFAPQVLKMKQLIGERSEPPAFVVTVNSGAIPADHWVQSPEEGGGRIIGEACHFIDLLRFLAGAQIKRVHAICMGSSEGLDVREDKAIISLEFESGAVGAIHYLANGHRSFPKERVEVFCGGSILQLDNFRRMQGFGWPGFRKMNLSQQDKGNSACIAAFIDAIRAGGPAPIPIEEILEVASVTLDAAEQLVKR